MSILESFFNGDIYPYEMNFEHDEKYQKANTSILKNERQLIDLLSTLPNAELANQTLQDLIDANTTIIGCTEEQFFVYGFRLGARFILDTFITTGSDMINN